MDTSCTQDSRALFPERLPYPSLPNQHPMGTTPGPALLRLNAQMGPDCVLGSAGEKKEGQLGQGCPGPHTRTGASEPQG